MKDFNLQLEAIINKHKLIEKNYLIKTLLKQMK